MNPSGQPPRAPTPVSSPGASMRIYEVYLATAGLAPSGVHVLRHAAAKLRREAGQSIEDVSHFLDHSSLRDIHLPTPHRGDRGTRAGSRRGVDWGLVVEISNA